MRLIALMIMTLWLAPLTASAIDLSNQSKHKISVKLTGDFGRTCYTSTLAPGQTTFFAAVIPECQKDLRIDYEILDGDKTQSCTMHANSGSRVNFDGSCHQC